MEEIHVAMCAAAATVYGRLVAPRDFYDIQHFNACLDLMACALARLAPVFATDEATGRQYRIDEMKVAEGRFERGATVLVLADGTRLRGLSIPRQDARQAFLILKAIGIDALGVNGAVRNLPPTKEDASQTPR